MDRISQRSYLMLFGVAFVFLIALAATVVLYADPYRLFRLPGAWPEAYPRPRAGQQMRLLKQAGIAALHPKTLVLGNSRAEIGFDPASTHWRDDALPVYNAAEPGTGIDVQVNTLSFALEHAPVRRLVVGLDFVDFIAESDIPDEEDDHGPTKHGTISYSGGLKTLFTLDALVDALVTLTSAHDPDAADVTARGFNPLNEYRTIAHQEGYGALFHQRDLENAQNYARLTRLREVQRSGRASMTNSWHSLATMLDIVRRHQIEATFVIYPYHAHTLELFQSLGLWPRFESWKSRLTQILAREQGVGKGRCALWDFSGYHRYAREPVPALGDLRHDVQWYWEAGHFKSSLGERMLAIIFGGQRDERFGECLRMETVEGVIGRIRAQRLRYAQENPSTVAELARIAGKARD
jgi:hypothetical protein